MQQLSQQKGAQTVAPSIGLSELIDQLHQLAAIGFPSELVYKTLQQAELSLTDLEPYIFYASKRYTRNQLYKTASFELILMCWEPGQASAIHGHEGQKCWMSVAAGALTFTNYHDVAGEDGVVLEKINTVVGQQGFIDGPAYIHSVCNTGAQSALSLHLYAHPFGHCDAYDLSAHTSTKIQLCYHSIQGKLVVTE